jgi:hypothetical protein
MSSDCLFQLSSCSLSRSSCLSYAILTSIDVSSLFSYSSLSHYPRLSSITFMCPLRSLAFFVYSWSLTVSCLISVSLTASPCSSTLYFALTMSFILCTSMTILSLCAPTCSTCTLCISLSCLSLSYSLITSAFNSTPSSSLISIGSV